MAGHSHSANIKHRKNAVDAKRGKLFSKLARAVISAARQGGGDVDGNPKLKLAVEKAKAGNMPKDSIARAIRRGTGEGEEASQYEDLLYEGYAPGGVAVLVACLTDNRNRTAPDIKHLFDKHEGNLGSPGSVAFLFDLRSVFGAETGERDEDTWLEVALEAGAEDVEFDGDYVTILASAVEFLEVKGALEEAGVELSSAETAYVPQNSVPVTDRDVGRRVLRLLEALEDNDDVQSVYANYDMPTEWLVGEG
ncbi:MAG: YebC/PmpR family DNA-binding transcriptional regulator [Planctomycetota bacterium]|jgi:YebC/PmpR family DNA-binding regulatory protein|nr:YebC/PmpR family DNA-binding transcriptional regulator [Planctomycetota bacterium]MDP6762547.1 YebC/PmpR family DNA-binding transcriptional regulator [Planctomycetota bacterium]MDP6990986.1 YebC/PmpR family DNA-binding transcriptional regulator [Planctomycetota bacterium]